MKLYKGGYIDREALHYALDEFYFTNKKSLRETIDFVSAADVVEVVRCKDCYYWSKVDDEPKGVCVCDKRTKLLAVLMDLAPRTEGNDYCSCGERKEG